MRSWPDVAAESSPGFPLAAAIDGIAAAARERQYLPGLSVAVARNGTPIFARGYGWRNLGERLPADAETIYSIASISKQFTAAALLQLAERGLLRFDDRLSRYFPWHPYGASIEVRHVLTHTSGIPDYFPLDDFDRIGFAQASPREIAETVLPRGPAFAPGAEFQYCNTGYVLLGAILEQVSGQTYVEYLQTHIFDPLGMTRTGVDDPPAIHHNAALGYTSFVLGPWEPARDYHPSWEFATGGMYSTVADLLRWNAALRAGRVISASSLAQMTARARLANGHALDYGFGVGVGDVGGRREIRHTGGLPGWSTDNTTYPDLGIDIVVFVNHDGCSTYGTIVRPILALLLDEPALRGSRQADISASSGLDEHRDAHDWLRGAAAGRIDDLPLAPKFARFLTARRRERFAALRGFGEITAITLADAGRRDPETTFSYRVDFERGPLVAVLSVRDGGTISYLQFQRWDDRILSL